MPPRRAIDEALTDITRPFLLYLTRLHADLGGRTEIRILRDSVVWSALVGPDDVPALVNALRPTGDAPRDVIPRDDHPRSGEANIYFTLGAVRGDCGAPVGLPLRRTKRTAKDADIVASPWVVVDVDPEREPKGRSSTDAEKASALGVAEAIRGAFEARGVPAALADSGNGWHLLVRTVPAQGDAVRAHAAGCKKLLHALDACYSTAEAKVDRAVHNAARIFKLYGTVSTKGTDTAENPHRLSSIVPTAIPEAVEALTLLADLVDPPVKLKAAPKGKVAERPSSAPAEAPEWKAWRVEALARLDLHAVYGEWLTGKARDGWLECRDPASPSGDRHPSAGVADGGGQAERGSFHSFGRGETMSVFDFLIERGRASDFVAACRRVAELSGVPLPARGASAPDLTLNTFPALWAATEDDAARDRLLAGVLRLAVALPTVQQDQALVRVREVTGLPPRAFNGAVSRAHRALRAEDEEESAPPQPSDPNRAVVAYVTNLDPVDALAEKILAIILPLRRFFRYERGAVYVHKDQGPIPLDEKNLPGILCAYLELGMYHKADKKTVFDGFEPLPLNLARALVHNPLFRSKLPVLTAYVRSPVFDRDWNFIATFGWHEPSGIFYDGPAVVPLSTTTNLDKALGGFPWKDKRDAVNCIGVLLTMLTIPMWTSGHPFVPINGNQAGVGKSTLARLIAAIVEGRVPPTVTFTANDEEFEKQLATRIEAGDRVIIVDNAKARGPISSAVLERCITDARISFRRLGSNTAIARAQNDVLFVLTMNLTQLGADLRRRALPLNLFIEGNVRNQVFTVDDPIGEVIAARVEILGELAGLVRAWVDAGRPMPEDPARHSVGQAWARTIDAILRHVQRTGFLSNFEESERAFDPDFETICEIADAHYDAEYMAAGEWADRLMNGILCERLLDRGGRARSPQSRRTIVGGLFTRYLDQRLQTPHGTFALRQHVQRKGHPPIYGFELLEPPEGVAEDGDIMSTDPGSIP